MMPYDTALKVLQIEADAIRDLIPKVGDSFGKAIDLLYACTGRVVTTGMGKSGFIAQKLSATLSSTGTPSLFLHPAEAIHGDLGRIVKGDVVVAISYSGETEEIVALLPTLKRIGVPLVSLTGRTDSAIAMASEVHLDVSIREEACPLRLAPTASTTAALAMGDALAMVLTEKRGFTVEEFADLHPGGRLGRKLLRVGDMMHKGDDTPRVGPKTPLKDVLFEMTKKRLGMTTVTDEAGTLLGVISDGDLRRLMERFGATVLGLPAEQGMTRTPHTIAAREIATRALDLMETNKITALVVIDASRHVEGVIHLHDLWKTEMV
jgi:arabinose-5-phosphate isomerase